MRFCGACGLTRSAIPLRGAPGRRDRHLRARRLDGNGCRADRRDDEGENQIVALPGANDHIGTPAAEPAVDVWVTGRGPGRRVGGVLAAAARPGRSVVVPAPAELLPAELVAQFDLAMLNETELNALGEHHPPAVVLTLGARGARILPDGPELPALPANVVDTTGAGDCLTGAVAASLAEGMPLAEAVRLGIAAASVCVERPGCQPAMPARAEAERRPQLAFLTPCTGRPSARHWKSVIVGSESS